jgi:hypothetical protein
MSNRESTAGATAGERSASTLVHGLLLIVSVLIVAAQVRLPAATEAALSFALTGALFSGWEECRSGWLLLRRAPARRWEEPAARRDR